MKAKSNFRRNIILAAASSQLAASLASAESFHWDQNGATAGTGGTGAWDTTSSFWRSVSDTGTLGTWVDAVGTPKNDAFLGGTAGTLTLGGTIQLRNLTFTNTAGTYIVTGSTLNFTSGTIVTNSVNGGTRIESNITGAPAVNASALNTNEAFTFRPAASGSQAIGAITGAGGNGAGIINFEGGAGHTSTVASSTGPKAVFNSSGTWTVTGTINSRNITITAGTVTVSTGRLESAASQTRGITMTGGTLNWNNAGAIRDQNTIFGTVSLGDPSDFYITGGTIDNTSGAAITTSTYNPDMVWGGNWTFNGSNGADSNLFLGNGRVGLTLANTQVTVTNSAATLSVGGVIQTVSANTNALTKAGAGTLRLTGASTYTGATTITAGTLSVSTMANGGSPSSIGQSSNAASNLVFNGGTLLYTGANATSNRAFTINAGTTATIETTNSLSLAGATGAATSGALTKTGAGTLILTGSNTYTGATNVNGGTLLINGSTSTSSAVTVASGATLGGSGGAVGGATTVNGTLAPGSSIGTLNFTNSLALAANSTYLFELNNTTDAADLTNLGVGASLTINTTSILDLVQLGTYAVGDKFTLFSYSSTLTGTFAGLANLATFTDAGGQWQIRYNDTSAGSNGGSGSSFVTVTAIPEPRAALLGGIGLLMLLRRRR